MKKLLIACGLLLAVAALLRAQQRTGADATLDAARKALNLGQYDQVAKVLGTSTDPRAIALRARIDIDHGRYAEAEKLADRARRRLRPGATPRSSSDVSSCISVNALRGRARSNASSQRVRKQPLRIWCASGTRSTSWDSSSRPTRDFRQANSNGAERCGDEHRMGRAVRREIQPVGCRQVIPGRADGRARQRAGQDRHGEPDGGHQSAGGAARR